MVTATTWAAKGPFTFRNAPACYTVVDHLVDAAGGGFGVSAVDPGCGFVADHVVVERGGVATHRVAHAGEVGPDALCGVGFRRDRLFDLLGRGVEEVSGDGLDQLIFGAREAVEGGLRAAEPLGQLVHGDGGESLGQHDVAGLDK